MAHKLTAPEAENAIDYIRSYYGGFGSDLLVSENTARAIDRLFETMSVLGSSSAYQGQTKREIWVPVPRGDLSDYVDAEEALAYGEYDSLEQIEKEWKSLYPRETMLSKLTAIEDSPVNFKGIYLGERLLISYRTDKPFDQHHDFSDLIDGLNDSAANAISILKSGEYEQMLDKYIDPADRTGTMPISAYWQYYPESKAEFYEMLDDSKITAFMTESLKDENSIGRMERMNAAAFYHVCALGYKASGHDREGLSDKEQYYKNADGRDDGLKDLDLNSFDEFEAWYFHRKQRGGHPWEVLRGGNSTNVSLYVWNDERGWYFYVSGSSLWRSAEAINMYLALVNAGYPTVIHDAELLRSRLDGTELIGIVPHRIIPAYCENRFPEESVHTFTHLDYEHPEEMAKLVSWQPLSVPKLA